jgi:hypothetical protein
MALVLTWQGKSRDFPPGSVLFIAYNISIQHTGKGVIRMSHSYPSTKFAPRRCWINAETPLQITAAEWSREFELYNGLVHIDILGEILVIEIVEKAS